jgi:hypothetical protein
MTRRLPRWTSIYAGVVLVYSVILILVGAWHFPVMTHGGPLGLPFLVLGLLLAPLGIVLWFGDVWAGVLAFAISLFPGAPLLWKDVVACGQPMARWLSEVSFLVVAQQFAACLKPLLAHSSLHTAPLIAPSVLLFSQWFVS